MARNSIFHVLMDAMFRSFSILFFLFSYFSLLGESIKLESTIGKGTIKQEIEDEGWNDPTLTLTFTLIHHPFTIYQSSVAILT